MWRLPDALRIALVLGTTGWVPVARYLRGQFLQLRRSDMVLAARAVGAGGLRIAVLHVMPCALAPVLVTTAFTVGGAIALEAALSFLGLGVAPPQPTWGGLLEEARRHLDRGWWLALFPGIALFAALAACNLIGEGLRDLLDPRVQDRAR
jgi:peptide/nickel transport system permease protein